VSRDDPTRRELDLAIAVELNTRIARGVGMEWITVAALRASFGGRRLTRSRKREISEALVAAGIDAYPPLKELSSRGRVRLEVIRSQPTPTRKTVRRRWSRLRARVLSPIGGLITLAASVVTLAALFLTTGTVARKRPTRMIGDLNIAIAPFESHGIVTPDGIALARATAAILRTKIPPLDRSLDIEIRGPDEMGLPIHDGVITSRSPESLARANGADIVVYGNLQVTPEVTRLIPSIFLNAEKLPSATTLSGQYGYGQAISFPFSIDVNPQTRASLRMALIRRTDAYAAAFIGIGYYLSHSLGSAERFLLKALRSSPSSASLPLLNLLLGNVADQRGDTLLAARYYTVASRGAAIRPRAEYGLAEATYQRARRRCQPGWSQRSGLLRARAIFAHVLRDATNRRKLDGPGLIAKVNFGLGQVDLCLSASRFTDHWAQARREFLAVTHAYRPASPSARDDAAEAHAGIGLCDLVTEAQPKSFIDARTEYETAFEITTIRARKAYFEGVVGFADEALGRNKNAVSEYRRAANLAVSGKSARNYSARERRVRRRR